MTTRETREGNTMGEPMTQDRREKYWRQYGWSPELSEVKRVEIEKCWSDPKVEEAQALGFR